MSDELASGTIRVYPDTEALSRAAADLFVACAAGSQGRFAVVLSGGQTPRRAYELLAQRPYRERVPWARVHAFWGDERCVPPRDARSNYRMACDTLLAHVPIPPGNIHPIDCADTPDAAARAYEAHLRDYFASAPPQLDLVLLGLGDDGHTASLFPGAPTLAESGRWAAATQAPDGLWRVTLTAPLINRAALVAFLVAGEAKAPALRAVREGPRDPRRWPAQLIHPEEGELLWLVDTAAARRSESAHQAVAPTPRLW